MKKRTGWTLLFFCAANAVFSAGGGPVPVSVFHDLAVPRVLKPGFPAYSDVSSRTLTIRDVPYDDEKNIFRAAKEFHLTRIDWAYIWFTQRELAAVQELKRAGYSFGGSAAQHIPCWIGDMAPADWMEELIMTDLQGNPSVMAFIRSWKNPQLIGDLSNPAYYAGHLEYYKKLIDAGCSSLQRDASEHHYLAVTTAGGGFTKTGVAGFSRWLAANVDAETRRSLGIPETGAFDYKAYLTARGAPVGDAYSRESYADPLKKYWYTYWEELSVEFFTRLVRDCKAYAGRDIPFSVNNTSFQRWSPLHSVFDMGNSELMLVTANPNHLRDRMLATEKAGKFQTIGSTKLLGIEVSREEKKALDCKVIATLYANGALGMVPWDTFEQSKDGTARFYGKPEDYAPIFGFVRGIADCLNGYDRAYDFSTGGILTAGISAGERPLRIEDTENEVCAFVRVNKQDSARPVVIHLIDWGKPLIDPKTGKVDERWELASGEGLYKDVRGIENLKRSPARPFEAVFSQAAFRVPAERLSFKLLTPRLYDRARHEAAESTGTYAGLVEEHSLTARMENGEIHLSIPSLQPWGVLTATVK